MGEDDNIFSLAGGPGLTTESGAPNEDFIRSGLIAQSMERLDKDFLGTASPAGGRYARTKGEEISA